MHALKNRRRRSLIALVGTTVVVPVGIVALVAAEGLTSGVASATTNATSTITAGQLSVTTSGSFTWAATLNGTDQSVSDGVGADQNFVVNDATGSGAGWNITAAATLFSCTSGACAGSPGEASLPTSFAGHGNFWFNGSTSDGTVNTPPSMACFAATTCTAISNQVSPYPVFVTPAASPTAVAIVDNAAGAGLGKFNIGSTAGANPDGWWIGVPANTYAGTYQSTVTIAANSGP